MSYTTSLGKYIDSTAQMALPTTGWTNINLLYFPDSIEFATLEGLKALVLRI